MKKKNDAGMGRYEDAAVSLLGAVLMLFVLAMPARAQLLRKNEFGVGVTVAVYQYDDVRSKEIAPVSPVKITANSPDEEIEYIQRNFGVEEMKFRYVRSVGLREGETFTDAQPINERQFTYTITPRLVTKTEVSFDFQAKYGDRVLIELKSATSNNFETLLLRGGRAEFGVKEFSGPNGAEKTPIQRGLLVTITPVLQTSRSLANRPSDISRPTDQFGSKVELSESDVFTMPAVIHREPMRFPIGSSPRGSITIEGIVTPEGRVTNIRVLDTPDSALNPKAIETFRMYRFNPAKINGRASYATYRETIVLGKQNPL